MINTFKRSFRNEDQMSVEGVELWSVRWTAITGEYSSDKEPVAEFFVSKQAAEDFSKALKDAFKLTRNSIDRVTVQRETVKQ